jgi:methylene-tetrahydromethanopterin dehydrogenase
MREAMADKNILHMLSPLRQVSPFDVNMALDAGFDAVIPYAPVTLEEVTGLVQDAIFSRPPQAGVRTGIFFGGRDAKLALDMLDAAKAAMVGPFVVSLFADPAGSFTTAAAMVARVETALRAKRRTLEGRRVVVFGATGVVGYASGVIAALQGARVTLAGYDGPARVAHAAEEIATRFGAPVAAADASSEALKVALVRDAEVVLAAGRAGVQILSREQVAEAGALLVAADVNAVPPAGIEGIDVHADAAPLHGEAVGIGALAIGGTKYGTEFGLFRRMIEAAEPVTLDFRDAFALARTLAGR